MISLPLFYLLNENIQRNMMTFLYKMASPRAFFSMTQSIVSIVGFLSLFFLLTGMIWGLCIAPADYQQGDAFRIIYIHVPSAFLSVSLYALMAFWAALFLIWRIKMAGLLLYVTVPVGAAMALCALVSGSLWGRPMWGAWWVWDARLTSELILFLFYIAILALSRVLPDRKTADRLLAIVTLVGAIDLPVVHYSVYWWNTLHQGSTLSIFAKPRIAFEMLYPLLVSLLGFVLYCVWSILQRAATELLIRERKQKWVWQDVFDGEGEGR